MINRLQALELHGYKTFANKTHFAFPGQVTAIVGPNGSGKSNIADSIRWVLGEQAYSVLRGKRTVDMIFSGSEQRSRASMASVSITFDNQNGWLPVDFSEVSITRRAYRDGDNEYLLNNQRVRLKEINELLANSGLGDRTYTIIGQGLVDTALSLRPDERRKFFEEAAGIGLYRDRREEAVQKLDKTLRNMERARDLVAELKPRIATLLRNKEKATHYKQIQNDLNLLLKDWYGFHWHQIQKELAFASDFFNHQKTEFQKIQIEKEKLEEQLNKIQANLNENRLELADLHKELAVFHTETEEITRKIAVLDEREKALRLRLSEVSGEIANNAEQESYIQSELTGLESIALRYKNEFKEVTELLKISNEKLGKKNREQEEIERQLKEIRTKILSSESQLLNFENTQNTYLREIQSKKDEIKKISEYLASVASSIQEIDKLRKENLGDLEKQNTSILMLESDQKSNLEELAKNQNIINKYIDKKQQTEALISRISAELEVISDAEEHLAGFNSGSGEIISASRSKLVPGKISLILDQIDIPEKYEIAIASVLGEILEGILLDSGSHTVEILDYLEKQKITRTVFIPCDLKISKKPQHPFNSKQLFFADSLISKEAAFSTVIKNLLSRTIIADSREEAINLFPELQPGWKIATLTGEIFDSLGTISAGIEYRAKPLKRKREKAELLVELSKQKMNIEEIGLAISSFTEKGEVIKNKAVSISNEIKSFNEKIATLSFENR